MAARKQTPTSTGTSTTTTTVPSVDPNAYAQNNPLPTGTAASSGGADTGVSAGYIPPPRQGITGSGSYSGIIGPNGEQLPFYNLNTKPGELLASFDEKSLKRFVKLAYSRGWYGSSKPGGGLSDADRNAMQNIMYYSNLKGVTWDQTFNSLSQAPVSTGTSSGPGTQVASTEDLIELAQRSALSTIGRKLTPDEAAKFAQAYQGTQRASSGSSMSPPSTDVYFQNRIEKEYGAESDGYKYLSAIGNVAKLMENM